MSVVLKAAVVMALGLMGTIYWETTGPDGAVAEGAPKVARASALPAGARVLTVAEAAGGWAATSLRRPLFRSDRRPVAGTTDVNAKGDQRPRLAGVMTGPFGNRAIFMSPSNPKPVVVQVGGNFGGMLVRSIEAGQVVVESEGSLYTIKPSFTEMRPPPRP